MADNETKVEVMAISLLTSQKLGRGHEPLSRKRNMALKNAVYSCFIMGRIK
jgi:hypothetical protein